MSLVLILCAPNAHAQGQDEVRLDVPGTPIPAANSVPHDQKAGSVLVFPVYTSMASATNLQNTRISLTNIDTRRSSTVHLFFVDGSSCSVSDSYICLTPNQTTSFVLSDLDPGVTGYIVAVAVNANGCPVNFNALIGDAYVKFGTGHAANLGAIAIGALPGLEQSPCVTGSSSAVLNFDGISYQPLPRVLAVDSLQDRKSGNDTMLIVDRIGGSLATGAARLGAVFGLLFDDAETPVSFSFTQDVCQFRASLSNNFPRTTPRYEQIIPAGRTGWMKFWSFNDAAILGVAMNFNPNAAAAASAFNQGHNLHTLTVTTSASVTIPVFPPAC
ncbi:MAG: hypothetical protein ACKVX9_22230 [Blastocatellia bacterium]